MRGESVAANGGEETIWLRGGDSTKGKLDVFDGVDELVRGLCYE